ncbi:hypothetical protein HPP92_027766 [Vanilla planifolia]|uniref:Uncharacterized protein n=1 Tax=Vanilla planifolia TaxID=51239 RepID=A0A835U5K0_VANPL|nr:hypothetical protein HPP92_027766 [Vanilla planifolia]KAG0448675.1 hypothetical protein HPP92_027722 [Vanilla planifolia]
MQRQDEFDKFMRIPDEWTPAEIKPYVAGSIEEGSPLTLQKREAVVMEILAKEYAFKSPNASRYPLKSYGDKLVWEGLIKNYGIGRDFVNGRRSVHTFAQPQAVVLPFGEVLLTFNRLLRFYMHRGCSGIFFDENGNLLRDFKGNVRSGAVVEKTVRKLSSKEELRQKNLFSVSDIKMYWQNNGEYLAEG